MSDVDRITTAPAHRRDVQRTLPPCVSSKKGNNASRRVLYRPVDGVYAYATHCSCLLARPRPCLESTERRLLNDGCGLVWTAPDWHLRVDRWLLHCMGRVRRGSARRLELEGGRPSAASPFTNSTLTATSVRFGGEGDGDRFPRDEIDDPVGRTSTLHNVRTGSRPSTTAGSDSIPPCRPRCLDGLRWSCFAC